ncbi:hypothetical protein SAMN05443575_2970 [Jatrophihabitans endophyticus]|uniref:TY-Chap central domain-containing protein n=1 Tax=Jatrophihabitans endophyticus TaxID=1206085 RepID=A0A1M5P3Q7_9ACTN|nr:hypothetical protein [Jatrophihabitans endophyticus]SHG96454.1 hypothetical protein SAMN05443575_2970 [Jatrophihabitans endophyticus]
MTELMWVRSHVEQLLRREWGVCRVEVDRDGDIPFRHGTAACWVSVIDGPPTMVRVLAHAAYELTPSPGLLAELNDINVRALSASVQLIDDIVVVQQTVSPVALTGPVLAQAVVSVAGIADGVGGLLAAMFDGVTPHRAVDHDDTRPSRCVDEEA